MKCCLHAIVLCLPARRTQQQMSDDANEEALWAVSYGDAVISADDDDDEPAVIATATVARQQSAPTLLAVAEARRERIDKLERCETTAWTLGSSVREPGTSFQVPDVAHRALTDEPRTAVSHAMCVFAPLIRSARARAQYALDVLKAVLNFRGEDGAQQRALAAGTSSALATIGKLRKPASGPLAHLAVWHQLAADRTIDRAAHDLDLGVASDFVDALCALGPLLTVANIDRLHDYHKNITVVANAATTLIDPVSTTDWIRLLSHSQQRAVPFDCAQPACLVCLAQPDNAADGTYFVTNPVCTAHLECAFVSSNPACACQALFCIECAARLFEEH
jgi:hypothetical protein